MLHVLVLRMEKDSHNHLDSFLSFVALSECTRLDRSSIRRHIPFSYSYSVRRFSNICLFLGTTTSRWQTHEDLERVVDHPLQAGQRSLRILISTCLA